MKKSILLTAITLVTAITLTACSTGETKNQNVISESQNTASNSISSSESESSNTKDVINASISEKDDAVLTVKIHSATSADLSLYNVTIDDSNKLIGTCEILINQYSISLASLGNDEPQCSIWKNSNGNGTLVSNIDYTYEDNVLTFYADMSAISGFDFNTVDTYTVYIDSDGRGGPQIAVPASEAVIADETTNPSASQGTDSTESDSNNAYTQVADKNIQALTDEQLTAYVGSYIDTSTNNTCSFICYDGNNGCTYRIDQIAINDATQKSPDSIASPFAAREFEQNADGNFSIRRPTYLGFCTVTFLPNNQIALKLEYSDGICEGTFSKR